LRSTGSHQLSFAFADSPQGGGPADTSDVTEAKHWLLHQANGKEVHDPVAGAGETAHLRRSLAHSFSCSLMRHRPEEPDVRSTSPVL